MPWNPAGIPLYVITYVRNMYEIQVTIVSVMAQSVIGFSSVLITSKY